MRYLCIGEPLVEFTARRDAPSTFDRRAGGDTLNSAVYLARLLPAGSVGYLSRLGDDAMSAWLREVLRRPPGQDRIESHPLPPMVAAVDTTGAGDSFNAGWLAACDAGLPPAAAVAIAARLAAVVVAHPGAVIPRSAMPDLGLRVAT